MLKLIYKKEKNKYISKFAGSRDRSSSLDINVINNEIKECDSNIEQFPFLHPNYMCFIDDKTIEKRVILKIDENNIIKTVKLKRKKEIIYENRNVDVYLFEDENQDSKSNKLLVKKFNFQKEFEKEKEVSKKIYDLQIYLNYALFVIPSYFNKEYKYIIMHYKDGNLYSLVHHQINSNSYNNNNNNTKYYENWIQIIETINILIQNNVFVFDLKLENIVFKMDTTNNTFKFYLIDLGGYMILDDNFLRYNNEFVNTYPLLYPNMIIQKDFHDSNLYFKIFFINYTKLNNSNEQIIFENITFEQFKNISYYNVLYSLLVSILIFNVSNIDKQLGLKLSDIFYFKNKINENIINLTQYNEIIKIYSKNKFCKEVNDTIIRLILFSEKHSNLLISPELSGYTFEYVRLLFLV